MRAVREMINDALSPKDDIPTVLAAGVLAATLAAVIHESVGHGVGCLTEGGTITVLTSIWFRCRGAGSLTVAAGPAASLVAGLACLLLLRRWRPNGGMQLAITLSAAFNLFWFAGQLIFHAITNGDTWAVMARMHHWPEWWRPVSIALGAVCYVAAAAAIINSQRLNGQLPWGAILYSYAAGTFSAMLAGLMWAPMPIRSALEGLLALGAAPAGLLAIAAAARREPNVHRIAVARSTIIIIFSISVYVIFLATIVTTALRFQLTASAGMALDAKPAGDSDRGGFWHTAGVPACPAAEPAISMKPGVASNERSAMTASPGQRTSGV
jgi:hypothetical protein